MPNGQKQSDQLNNRRSRFASVDELADRIERDRREADKIITYCQQLRGLAHELRDVLEWAEKPEGDAYLRMTDARTLLRSIARGTD
jgi:hypothetical protein